MSAFSRSSKKVMAKHCGGHPCGDVRVVACVVTLSCVVGLAIFQVTMQSQLQVMDYLCSLLVVDGLLTVRLNWRECKNGMHLGERLMNTRRQRKLVAASRAAAPKFTMKKRSDQVNFERIRKKRRKSDPISGREF